MPAPARIRSPRHWSRQPFNGEQSPTISPYWSASASLRTSLRLHEFRVDQPADACHQGERAEERAIGGSLQSLASGPPGRLRTPGGSHPLGTVTPPGEEQEADDHETHDQHHGAPDAELAETQAVTNARRSPEEPESGSL